MPNAVRPGFFYTLSVTYGNTGDADAPAPLFTVTNTEGAPMTLTLGNPYVAAPLQLLGIAQDGPAGVLPPDSQYTLLVYFQVPPSAPIHTTMSFNLSHLNPDTTPINWSVVPFPAAPAGMGADAWAVVTSNIVAQIGPDNSNYVQELDNDATFYSQEGKYVYDPGVLFNLELLKAVNDLTPSQTLDERTDDALSSHILHMEFTRIMPSAIDRRFQIGPFGRGWAHNFQFSLSRSTFASNVVDVSGPEGSQRFFFEQPNQTWIALPGDSGVLQSAGNGAFTLTEADGSLSRYDSNGRLVASQDTTGNQLTFTYAGANLTAISHSDGDQFTFTYNSFGRVSSLTDSAGQVVRYNYDAGGEHLLSVVSPGNVVNSYTYVPATGSPADHAVQSIAFADGSHRYYSYDGFGRIASSSVDNNSEELRFSYDAVGDIFQTNALGDVAVIGCNERGQTLKISDALDDTATLTYSPNFDVASVTQPEGEVSTVSYDALSRETGSVDALGQQVALGYTNLSRMATVEDRRSKVTTYNYDTRGNLAQTLYPDQSAESATFDNGGSVTNYVNRRGQTISFLRNARGQMTRKALPDGRVITYQYDGRGNPTNITDNVAGVMTFAYDARDFLINLISADGHSFAFTYDNAGHRTQRMGDDGYILNYSYDAAGRLAGLSDGSNNQLVQYVYDAEGKLIHESKANGTSTAYAYDAGQRLIAMTNFAPNATAQSFFNYTFGANGETLSMTSSAGVTYYQYDAIEQLVGVEYPSGRQVTYAYDAAGNRTTMSDSGTNTTYQVNSVNRYTQAGAATLLYDADGNLTNRIDASGTTSYQYDAENKLIGVTDPTGNVWQYEYDALGRRLAATFNEVTTHYVVDPRFADVAAEYDAAGVLLARYNQALGMLARIDRSGNAAYYSFDGSANTRELTDPNGAVLNSYDYDAFGATTAASEMVSNEFQFVGRFGVTAEPNRMHYMKNRYYSPDLGRFQSDDPIRLAGGVNLVEYADNNPISKLDPWGLRDTTGFSQARARAEQEVPDPIDTVDVSFSAAAGGGGTGGITFSMSQGIQVYGGGTTGEGVGVGVGFATSSPTEGVNVAVTVAAPGGYYQVSFSGPNAEDQAKEYIRTMGQSGLNGVSTEFGLYAGSPSVTISTFYVSPPVQFDVSYAASFWYNNLIEAFTTRRLNDSSVTGSILVPGDPNDKAGPIGFGPNAVVSASQPLAYTITFVNASSNTAPAHTISITDQLDPNLDPRTFRLTEIIFGTNSIAIPPNRSFVQTNLTLSTVAGLVEANVVAGVDISSGAIFCTLTAIDPATGQSPANPALGLLPPDDANGDGEGRVSYTVSPVAGAATGTTVTNAATIVFDSNPPLTTAAVVNTLDAGSPASQLTVSTNLTLSDTFTVSWSGTDTNGASGLSGYDVYVSDNGGPFQIWLANTTLTSAPYVGQPGHTYRFYSIAIDNAGNVQSPPANPEATVYVSDNTAPMLAAISNDTVNVGSPVFFTNVVSDADVPPLTLTFGLLPGAPAGAIVYPTTGVFRWTPSAAQAGTTNLIGITVTNDGVPPLSAAQTFTVVVNDYVETSFGDAVAIVGQDGAIPINLFSSAGLASLNFTLNYPAGTMDNFSLTSLAAPISAAGVHIV
jgi:RHS repeat-associated protein